VWMLARLRRLTVSKLNITPRASIIIACHNEANNIRARIKNLLECDYPADLLEIIIVSDGSTDLTEQAVRRSASGRAQALAYDRQKGKAVALNLGVEQASGEIIIFADARASTLSRTLSVNWRRISQTFESARCRANYCSTRRRALAKESALLEI